MWLKVWNARTRLRRRASLVSWAALAVLVMVLFAWVAPSIGLPPILETPSTQTVSAWEVTFVENGLPAGTSWSVLMDGITNTSTTSTIGYSMANGTYSYSVSWSGVWQPKPVTGNVTVKAASVQVQVIFTIGEWNVTFTETGLPVMTPWSMMMYGITRNTSTNSITYTLANGTYTFAVNPTSGQWPWWQPFPASGSVRVAGSPISVLITFKAASNNWGGYVFIPKSGGNITEVTAEWKVPSVTCNEPSGAAVQVDWIGIDGATGGTVEQVGSGAVCSSPGSTPSYLLWYEFIPYESSAVEVGAVPVNPSDLVQAYVLFNPAVCVSSHCGVYTLQETDLTTYAGFVVAGNPSVCNSSGCEGGPDDSAECISEAPLQSSGAEYPLADYASVTFEYCSVGSNGHYDGIGSLPGSVGTVYTVFTIGDVTGKIIQSPGSLSNLIDGKSVFNVTWKGFD